MADKFVTNVCQKSEGPSLITLINVECIHNKEFKALFYLPANVQI